MKFDFKKNKKNILWMTIAVFSTLFIFPNYFEANIYPLPNENDFWISLDQSWLVALNYFNIQKLNWGSDVIFTYGPLSYLSTRVGWGQSRIDFLLYDIFISLNFLSLFFINLKNTKNLKVTLFFLFTILLIYPLWVGSSNALILLAFLVFWIRQSIERPKKLYYLFQIIILVLVFFVKFNTGLVAFPLFISGLLYNFYKNKSNRVLLLIYLILPLLLILFFSNLLNVNTFDYIKNGFQIISGYNEIMYLAHNDLNKIFAILILLITVSLLFHNTYLKRKTDFLKNITIAFIFGSSIFVLYKQGFVRGMEEDFFIYSPLLVFSLKDFHQDSFNTTKKTFLLITCSIISISFNFLILKTPPNILEKSNKIYVQGFNNFTPTSGIHFSDNQNQFPILFKQKIGNSKIDVYPWNIQLLLENKLNYSPRPVPQSYSAYTPFLEEQNFNFYNSENAPKFILYNFASIDNRYPLFDESKLQLVIEKNYSVVDSIQFNNSFYLLLEKKNSKKIKLNQIREYAMNIDSPLIPKEGIFYKVYVYRNIIGEFISIINHSPEISLNIQTKDGSVVDYKSSIKLLESGFFGTFHVTDTHKFKKLITENDLSQNEIAAYYFKPRHQRYFKDKIRVIEYKIEE